MTTRLLSIHTMDPRGSKVGGIETHVRQLLRRHPADIRLVMVGVDEAGDLPLFERTTLTLYGRQIDFIPIIRVTPDEQKGAAKTIGQSVTLRFTKALMGGLLKLKRLVGTGPGVAEIERHEFAIPARLLGVPLVVLVHNGGSAGATMDSILSRHWWVYETAEWIACRLASRIFCVTPKLTEELTARYPSGAKKIETMTVSVETDVFTPTSFDTADGVLRVVYAGRLDAFKDPPLMFKVAARLAELTEGRFEFHYCGASDPERFPEYQAIRHLFVRHGALTPEGVRAVMAKAHVGILVSHFEGMPCFLLELLASGRPFGGLRLPQFDQVVRAGVSGAMVDRMADEAASRDAVADLILKLWDDIQAGRIDPAAVAGVVEPFSVERQLGRLFQVHRELAGAAPPPSADGRAALPPLSTGERV